MARGAPASKQREAELEDEWHCEEGGAVDQKERKAQDDRGKEGKTEREMGRGKPGEIRGIVQLYGIVSHFRLLRPIE